MSATDVAEVKVTLQKFTFDPNHPDGGHLEATSSRRPSSTAHCRPATCSSTAAGSTSAAGSWWAARRRRPACSPGTCPAGYIDVALDATLFVRNAQNQELRVVATCYDANGAETPAGDDGEQPWDFIYPQTSGLETFTIERDPCADPEVVEVGVTVELKNVATGQFDILGERRIPLPSV